MIIKAFPQRWPTFLSGFPSQENSGRIKREVNFLLVRIALAQMEVIPGRPDLNSAAMLAMIDGKEHDGVPTRAELPADQIESVEVLKGAAAKALYGADKRTRFRPGYYPFTEPSVARGRS